MRRESPLKIGWSWLAHQAWYQKLTRQTSLPGACSLGITAGEVLLTVLRNPKQPIIDPITSVTFEREEELPQILEGMVSSYDLKNMPCHWILYPNQYQLYLIDYLPVPDEEFQSAVRWKLMELVPFPIEDAIIDSFSIPAQKTHDPRPMMMVSVARADILNKGAEAIINAGFNLISIGIQTLALRNIATFFETDEQTTALIYFEEETSEVLLTRLGLLYLQRNLGPGWRELQDIPLPFNPEKMSDLQLEKLALELQRSFDYYQAQWRHPFPSRVLFYTSAPAELRDLIIQYFSSRLAIKLTSFLHQAFIPIKSPALLEKQAKYLPLIGGLISKGQAPNAARS